MGRNLLRSVQLLLVPVIGVLILSCSAKTNYDDDIHLPAVRTQFKCSTGANPSACAAIDKFEKGGRVVFPSSGAQTYLGELYWSKSVPSRTLQSIVLEGAPTPAKKVDEKHQAAGSWRPGATIVSNKSIPELTKAVDKILDSVKAKAKTPGIDGMDKVELLPKTWAGWTTAKPSIAVAQSGGSSLLVRPGSVPRFWDDAQKTGAMRYARTTDDGHLIVITPPDGAGLSIVWEGWPMP